MLGILSRGIRVDAKMWGTGTLLLGCILKLQQFQDDDIITVLLLYCYCTLHWMRLEGPCDAKVR